MEHDRTNALLALRVTVGEATDLFAAFANAYGPEAADAFENIDLIDLGRLISVRRAVRAGFWNEGK